MSEISASLTEIHTVEEMQFQGIYLVNELIIKLHTELHIYIYGLIIKKKKQI